MESLSRQELETEVIRLRGQAVESERLLRREAVFDSAVDFGIVVTDKSGIVNDWNRGAELTMGWSAGEMVGQSAERFFTPEDRAIGRIETEMRTALSDGSAADERWHLRKDGSRFWASGEMMPLRDDEGTHRGFVKILRDRTAQRLAGERLRVSEERFRTLLETIDTAFALVEVRFDADDRPVDYRFLEANPAFERQAGVNLRSKWVTEFAPNLEQFWFDTYGHVARTGEAATFENYAEAFSRWFDVRAIRVGDPAERQIAIFFNDVTARKEAEAALRASEAIARENIERVQLALGAGAIIGTWFYDLVNDRFTVDESFARAFGLDPDFGRVGLSMAQVVDTVHPDDREALAAAIEDAISRRGSYAHQYRTRRADGNYYWLEANGRVNSASDGTPLSFPGVLIDIEERRAVEAERERVTEMLRNLNETLEQRVAEKTAELMASEEALRQSQKMEAVGQLTGGLAHDFNNLLAGISGSLDMMQTRIRQERFGDLERYMTGAQGAAKRAAALTHRLLAFSRRQTLEPKATDVERLVAGMEDMVRRTVGPEIAVELHGDANLWPVLVDPNQLENALLNLCINARDAMPDGGRIVIEASNRTIEEQAAKTRNIVRGDYVTLAVSDNGVGMSPEIMERVFEPFFTTKPIGLGTGLGLSMIYGFAKQSGGEVRVHSHVGQGTTVTIFLPRHSAAEVILPDLGSDTADRSAKSGERVLVIDDEPLVRMLVVDVLEDLGYSAIEAGDGPEGMHVLQSGERIDLLITDVGLPKGMNGRQVADAARQLRPGLKVLFVTGYAENAVLSHGHLYPGMEVVTKPFDMNVLAKRIQDLISS